MQIQVETNSVNYRLRGKPILRIRAIVYVDYVRVGSFLATPDVIDSLLSTLHAGAQARLHQYTEFRDERHNKPGQVLEHNPDAKGDPSGTGLSPSNKRTKSILP